MSKQVKPITVKKQVVINRQFALSSNLLKSYKVVKPITYKEDVIYTSKPSDFFSGEVRSLQIVNKLNLSNNTCRTIACCVGLNGEVFEKNSDEISALIGQNNYDMLLSSICSILSQELKLRGIWALLTKPKKKVNCLIQTEYEKKNTNLVSIYTQTAESTVCFNKIGKKTRRRNKVSPYVLANNPEIKRVIIDPESFPEILKRDSPDTEEDNTEYTILSEKADSSESPENITTEKSECPETPESLDKPELNTPELPELGSVFDDDCDRLSSITVSSIPGLLTDPIKLIDRHTKDLKEENMVDTDIYLNLPSKQCQLDGNMSSDTQNKNPMTRDKLKSLLKDGLEALKNCLEVDSEGYMRIHIAITNNDVEMLKKQCIALKMRNASVDITADGQTPLRMSLYQDNPELTSVLLTHGADILECDEEEQTPVHLAATLDTDHLELLIDYCRKNARKILQNSEDCWKPEYEHKSDVELSDCLLQYISRLPDRQGFTPLMRAAQLGRYNNVTSLSESCRSAVNHRAVSSGNTALYEAVRAACMDCVERGNKAKVVHHHYKTIKILLENGADPNIENFYGSTVNDVVTEYNIQELSLLVANTISSVRCKPLKFVPIAPKMSSNPATNYMLYKEKNGTVIKKELNVKSKPKILANVPVKLNNDTRNNDKNNGKAVTIPEIVKEFNTAKSLELKKIPINKPLILKKAVKRKSSDTKAPVTNKKVMMLKKNV